MLTLRTRKAAFHNEPDGLGREVVRVSCDVNRPRPLREGEIFLIRGNEVPEGYRAYVVMSDDPERTILSNSAAPLIVLPKEFSYLEHGDVVAVDWPKGGFDVLYRRQSLHNSFLVTERCNHYCLMCSQPPRDVNDSWLVDEILAAIPLVDPDTKEIGFTGGEPTLLGDGLIAILRKAKSFLPRTSLHILTNGRRFAGEAFAAKYGSVGHPDMMAGIPIYSDVGTIHDYVVQSDGAFDDTIRGILNLKRHRQKVEIRVVVHKQTFARLPQLGEFIARNLMMVDHVALMGLEITGFTRANLPDLWIDPWDYREELSEAVEILSENRMNVSVYNHPLCVTDEKIWPFTRQSISDWKNEYMPECEGCTKQGDCGGFFSSAKHRYSSHIAPI